MASLGGKGLIAFFYKKHGLKWDNIIGFVEKTPKVTEMRKYFYLFV